MVLELHIWGPAFSIPSIDAQCIATVAYFTQAVPQGEWVVIASSDPSLCPTSTLAFSLVFPLHHQYEAYMITSTRRASCLEERNNMDQSISKHC